MPKKAPTHRPIHLDEARAASRQAYYAERGSAAARGYGKRWQRRRLAQLAEHPLCEQCEREGRTTAATVADHLIPHRGDSNLFWLGELQSLCKQCHDKKTGRGM